MVSKTKDEGALPSSRANSGLSRLHIANLAFNGPFRSVKIQGYLGIGMACIPQELSLGEFFCCPWSSSTGSPMRATPGGISPEFTFVHSETSPHFGHFQYGLSWPASQIHAPGGHSEGNHQPKLTQGVFLIFCHAFHCGVSSRINTLSDLGRTMPWAGS